MAGIFSVIKSPLVTEKGAGLAADRQYFFWVEKLANKIQIKHAVEKVYNVKVDHVATMIIKGKSRRLRSNQAGRTSDWKKAIVTLRKGFEIKFT
jgi:large subunit ribosomal protein L23